MEQFFLYSSASACAYNRNCDKTVGYAIKGSILDGGLCDSYKAQLVMFKTRDGEEKVGSKWSELKQQLCDNEVRIVKSRDIFQEVH